MVNIEDYSYSKAFKKEEREADMIYELRKKCLVPILKDGELFIYKIDFNKKFNKLLDEYESNFGEIYNGFYLNSQEFRSNLRRSSYLSCFENMINYHQATANEVFDYLGLEDEKKKKEFLEQNAQEVEVKVPVNGEIYTKCYRQETIEEVLERVAPSYVVCTFKRHSKLANIMKFINYYRYFNLDFIASNMCEFFDLGNVNFSASKVSTLEDNEDKVRSMQFCNKEKELPNDDKLAIVRAMFESLKIECTYCGEIDKTPDFLFKHLTKYEFSNSKKIITNFAKHNNDILENSAFSEVFHNIKAKGKVLEKKPNNN